MGILEVQQRSGEIVRLQGHRTMRPKKVEHIEQPEFQDVKSWFDENLAVDTCDLNDQDVYEGVYHEGRWAGVFQFTEGGAQRFATRAKPRSIDDLAAITSIYRPGPLTANVDREFVRDKERVEAGEQLEYEHPVIEEILSKTYGHMCFQEDFMKLGNQLGKLSWDDCDKLRKILVKKSIGQDVNDKKRRDALKIKEKFKQGAMENGMSEDAVERLWERMEYFSGYGFNLCLHPKNKIKVYDRLGNYCCDKSISKVVPSEYVRSRDECTGDDIFVEVKAVYDNGVHNVYEYTFDDGSKVKCTPDHKFRTVDGRMLSIRQVVEEGLDVVSVRQEVDTGKAVYRSSVRRV